MPGRSLIVAAAAALLCACAGEAGSIPDDFVTYGFQASVEVATQRPEPGRRVDLIVDVRSTGNTPVNCDVMLKVVSAAADQEIYRQQWQDVKFMPDAPWNLSNGFLPPTDATGAYKLSVEVRRHTTGELMYLNSEVSQLVFSTT